MKKLIFVDNDDARFAKESLMYVQDALDNADLPKSYIDTISIISDFSRMDKDESYKLFFSKENCICTWSMYTATNYGSLQQMTRFLRTAGSSDIKEIVYVDCSGMMFQALARLLNDSQRNVMPILRAIESNFIISVQHNCIVRIRVDLEGDSIKPLQTEPVNLRKLLIP